MLINLARWLSHYLVFFPILTKKKTNMMEEAPIRHAVKSNERVFKILGMLDTMNTKDGILVTSLSCMVIFISYLAFLGNFTHDWVNYPVLLEAGHLSVDAGGAIYQHTLLNNNEISVHQLPEPLYPTPVGNTSYVSTFLPNGYVANCTMFPGGNFYGVTQKPVYRIDSGGILELAYTNLGQFMLANVSIALYLVVLFLIIFYAAELIYTYWTIFTSRSDTFAQAKPDTERLVYSMIHLTRRLFSTPPLYLCILVTAGTTDQMVLFAAVVLLVICQMIRFVIVIGMDRMVSDRKKKLDPESSQRLDLKFGATKSAIGAYGFLEMVRFGFTIALISNQAVTINTDKFSALFTSFPPLSIYITFLVLLFVFMAYDLGYLCALYYHYNNDYNYHKSNSSLASNHHYGMTTVDMFVETILVSVIFILAASYLTWGTLVGC